MGIGEAASIAFERGELDVRPILGKEEKQELVKEVINQIAEEKGYESRNKTGAVKNDAQKPRMSLVPQLAKYLVGKVMTYGEYKYAAFNWMDGFQWTYLADAIERHYIPFMCGEDNDKESGLPHLAHLACSVMMALENCYLHPEMDDRAKIWKTEIGVRAREEVLTPFVPSEYLKSVLAKKKSS